MESIKAYYQQIQQQQPVAAVVLQLCGVIAILLIISRMGLWAINRIFKTWHGKVAAAEHTEEHLTQIKSMKKSVQRIWRYAVLLMIIPLSITMFNISLDSYSSFQESLFAIPLLGVVIQLTIIVILSYIGLKIGTMAIMAAFERQRKEQMEESKGRFFRSIELKESKLRTLQTISLSTFKYAIYFIAFLSILAVFNIPTSTVITGAGVLGVAIGFGAQSLVKDIIVGAFIIFEDQFDVGDYIEISGIGGIVDGIGIRTTRIKGFDGALHYIPNGQISTVSNLSRYYRRALVDVSVAYKENLVNVEKVLSELCAEIQHENPWIVSGPTLLGVQNLGESDVVFRIIAQTEPMEQWRAERLLRYQIKNRFDELGIEIPFPHRVMVAGKVEEKHDKA